MAFPQQPDHGRETFQQKYFAQETRLREAGMPPNASGRILMQDHRKTAILARGQPGRWTPHLQEN
jgi:hypothetical protein